MAIEVSVSHHAPATARHMQQAATRFLETLSAEQSAVARFPFEGDERYFWHYTPVERNGLMVRYMSEPQRQAAFALQATGLSARGDAQVHRIIALEPILRETERIERIDMPWVRDSEQYWFSVFGDPEGAAPWAWRVGGHHVGLHFTIIGREMVSPLPLFFGANPVVVNHGPQVGSRTLAEEEDMARTLLMSLNPAQKGIAIVNPVAPDDILTRNYRTADSAVLPVGLKFQDMEGGQRQQLVELIRHYVDRSSVELAANEWSRIERAGLEPITFAWSGPQERARGNGHYYVVRGPTFMIEYDNTQNDANHIHSVLRDFTNDWGEDLLAQHYASDHQH